MNGLNPFRAIANKASDAAGDFFLIGVGRVTESQNQLTQK